MSINSHITVVEPTLGVVPLDISEFGSGHPFLLLHGGGGQATVDGFAELLAQEEHAHVYVPTHPGFGGTSRPEALNMRISRRMGADFARSWARVSRHAGQPFHRIVGWLADAFMESGLSGLVKHFCDGGASAQAFT